MAIHEYRRTTNLVSYLYIIASNVIFVNDQSGQFFRADSNTMKDMVNDWMKNGWVAPWKARFGILPEIKHTDSRSEDRAKASDFFGVPSPENNSEKENVYIGVGGMHHLPRKILESSTAIVHKGTRVSGVASRTIEINDGDGTTNTKHVWDLTTTVGAAAFHDTKESVATEALEKAKTEVTDATETALTTNQSAATRIVVHRGFDAVVFTNISSSSDSCHRPQNFEDAVAMLTANRREIPSHLRRTLFRIFLGHALRPPCRGRLANLTPIVVIVNILSAVHLLHRGRVGRGLRTPFSMRVRGQNSDSYFPEGERLPLPDLSL